MQRLYRSEAGHGRVSEWCSSRLRTWSVPHDSLQVETELGRTHVLLSGTGDSAVVYLPGTNFNSATSLTLINHLVDHCRVFVADLPGQPGLSAPRGAESDAAHGEWVSEVLSALPMDGVNRVVLAGHSRGAYVALVSDPETVDGVVLVNPAGIVKVAASPAILRTAVPWVLRPNERRSSALLRLMSGQPHEPNPELVSWLTLVAKETRTSGAPGPAPMTLTDRWKSRNVRVLSGQRDCFFRPERLGPAVRERLAVDLEVLPGIGHLSVEEAPEAVAHFILRTLG